MAQSGGDKARRTVLGDIPLASSDFGRTNRDSRGNMPMPVDTVRWHRIFRCFISTQPLRLSENTIAQKQADQVGKAMVNPQEFVERARGNKQSDIYGLGMWREEFGAHANATLIGSPSWARTSDPPHERRARVGS